jgi:hypothetical protein
MVKMSRCRVIRRKCCPKTRPSPSSAPVSPRGWWISAENLAAGPLAREHLVKDRAERVDIAAGVDIRGVAEICSGLI